MGSRSTVRLIAPTRYFRALHYDRILCQLQLPVLILFANVEKKTRKDPERARSLFRARPGVHDVVRVCVQADQDGPRCRPDKYCWPGRRRRASPGDA